MSETSDRAVSGDDEFDEHDRDTLARLREAGTPPHLVDRVGAGLAAKLRLRREVEGLRQAPVYRYVGPDSIRTARSQPDCHGEVSS